MSRDPRANFYDLAGEPPEVAKFFWSGGPVQVAERTWFASLFSGCTAFDTDEGLVLVDTGLTQLAPGLAASIRTRTQAPVHTAIYTHGHVDHAFGLDAFLIEGQAPPRVFGHRRMLARFERYARTPRHNAALNARQFGGTVDEARTSAYDTFGFPPQPPTELYDERLEVKVGGLSFELVHGAGETDDHTWLYCQDRGVLCTGDLFIWGVPNAGNPQKVQRYPWSWAESLRQMATCKPRTLCPGHGGPVVDDPELVERMLLETAQFLEAIVERTVAVLEDGSPPHVDVVRRVALPRSDSPWLQPVYDEAEFIVRNVIRHYGGWYSGRPSELKPAPRREVATEIALAAGGPLALLERAQKLAARGQLPLACHLADYALEASPDERAIRLGVAELYEQRAEQATSLMAVNLYRSAAAYARSGRAFA